MSEVFIWDDQLETGDPTVDSEHKRIIMLANEIISDLIIKDVKRKVFEIYEYTSEHFQHEEELMREKGFPDLAKHMKEHNELLSRLHNLANNFSSSEQDCELLKQIIGDWVGEHVLLRDREMSEALHS